MLQWRQTEAFLKKKGEILTFEQLLPPTPPDRENFFADPLWLEMAYTNHPKEEWLVNQWKVPLSSVEISRFNKILECKISSFDRAKAIQNLKKKLDKTHEQEHSREIALLLIDLARPANPLLAKISELSTRTSAAYPARYQDAFDMQLPHITAILTLGQVLGGKSLAELKTGNTNGAYNDIVTLLGLAKIASKRADCNLIARSTNNYLACY